MSSTYTESRLAGPLNGPALLGALAQNWWLLALRGVVAIAFGVLAFIWPGITLLTLTLLWGAYTLSDGVFALWAAIAGKGGEMAPRWWLGVVGVASILAGLVAFLWPGMTALVLLLFIASWAIIIGVLQVWGAIRLRKEIEGEWLLALNGILSIAFGVILMVQPGVGALAVVWLIGWYAILAGGLAIALAFRLKQHKQHV
jgi:uncharacterized membrane protein HdeD (DUF308 family)